MSYTKRKVELRKCDCLGCNEDDSQTVHCETEDGNLKCEVCGRVKE